MEKEGFDQLNALDGKCVVEPSETACVCATDLCNDGKEDEDSGIEKFVPKSAMIFLLSISVFSRYVHVNSDVEFRHEIYQISSPPGGFCQWK